jgi:hypothetical protein
LAQSLPPELSALLREHLAQGEAIKLIDVSIGSDGTFDHRIA